MRRANPLPWLITGAVVLSLGVILWVLLAVGRGAGNPAVGDGREAASYGFRLENLAVPADLLVASGVPRDRILVRDAPAVLTAADVDRRNAERRGKLLVPNDRVVGVVIGDEARAYPLRILQWHEIVNDRVAGEPIAATYSPLCDAVVVFSRRLRDRVLRFGHSGLLYQSNLVMYDRRARVPSLWSQLVGRAIAGPEAGTRLTRLPFSLTTWAAWRAEHPQTTVLAPDPRLGREYRRAPYSSYFGSEILRFPVKPLPEPTGARLKDRVAVIASGDAERVLILSNLARSIGASSGKWMGFVGPCPVEIRFDAELGTAEPRSLDSAEPAELVASAFWFAWYATHPSADGRRMTRSKE